MSDEDVQKDLAAESAGASGDVSAKPVAKRAIMSTPARPGGQRNVSSQLGASPGGGAAGTGALSGSDRAQLVERELERLRASGRAGCVRELQQLATKNVWAFESHSPMDVLLVVGKVKITPVSVDFKPPLFKGDALAFGAELHKMIAGHPGHAAVLKCLLDGDVTGGEPVLSLTETMECVITVGGMSNYDPAKMKVKISEYRLMCLQSPQDFEAHLNEDVRGAAQHWFCWAQSSASLFTVFRKAVLQSTHSTKVLNSQTVSGDAVALWAAMLKCESRTPLAQHAIACANMYSMRLADGVDIDSHNDEFFTLYEQAQKVGIPMQRDFPEWMAVQHYVMSVQSQFRRELELDDWLGKQLPDVSLADTMNKFSSFSRIRACRAADEAALSQVAPALMAGGAPHKGRNKSPDKDQGRDRSRGKGRGRGRGKGGERDGMPRVYKDQMNSKELSDLKKIGESGGSMCWNCLSPDHIIDECPKPCARCDSKKHPRVFLRAQFGARSSSFVCGRDNYVRKRSVRICEKTGAFL